uniref:Cell division protein ZapA n=1 Tax=Candidatus Kentrum sp. TC TaxID=2126339 RepID=A0A450ZH73_9GAMM|nr:MAG: cell division protein ZapA [Candidatus Kentron sp. TC]VFK38679.1 MAG: cell division protein ZapA [Candidatus Kentron sp. TC]VFK53162.1 MAG: cell division protein ZapA [Candidatus Kentron sp. TC]
MNKKGATPVNIQIMDKEYVVSCSAEEQRDLTASARILDERMRETRDATRVYGTERIAVMSALNIVHECLQKHHNREEETGSLAGSITQLVEKIDAAMSGE